MSDKWRIEKDLERSGHVIINVLSWNFLGETEKYHEKPQSGYPVSCARFELRTF
jgi:hypothetical protein